MSVVQKLSLLAIDCSMPDDLYQLQQRGAGEIVWTDHVCITPVRRDTAAEMVRRFNTIQPGVVMYRSVLVEVAHD